MQKNDDDLNLDDLVITNHLIHLFRDFSVWQKTFPLFVLLNWKGIQLSSQSFPKIGFQIHTNIKSHHYPYFLYEEIFVKRRSKKNGVCAKGSPATKKTVK